MARDDAEWLARWRSWVDPECIPEDWDHNLWDEFYGIHIRRDMWRGFQRVLAASPADARRSAGLLRRWILRNHVETQALAIRRIADRGTDDTVSLGRLLDEIAKRPRLVEGGGEATEDAEKLRDVAKRIKRFADRVVARFDRRHAKASDDVSLPEFEAIVDEFTEVWVRWFPRITGRGVEGALPPMTWPGVIRLRRRDPSRDNPERIAGQVVYQYDDPAPEVAAALRSPIDERVAVMGRLLRRNDDDPVLRVLMDVVIEGDLNERERLAEAFERLIGTSQ